MSERFANRREAGRQLADKLRVYQDNAVVLALPRGGVETAVDVAHELNAPLDLIIACKIPHPENPEYAIGAITADGITAWTSGVRGVSRSDQRIVETKALKEAQRRRDKYLSGRVRISLAGKVAILVDDGIATGATMRAAVYEVEEQHPKKIIIAVPVISRDTFDGLRNEDAIDEVVALITDDSFFAVAAYYENFPQLTDEDVINLLNEVG